MVIASRSLQLLRNHSATEIPIRIYLPEQESATAWSCRYEIDWPHGEWKHAAWGVDSVQAILIALQLIGSEIHASEYHRSGQLMLDEPGRGYGFPVTNGIRDMLIGDDAKFF